MAARIAVILSGCGFLDGAEIQESVLSLYFLDEKGCKVTCFAPDKDQFHVVDHVTGQPTLESRNVMTEAARICRGEIRPLADLKMQDFDAIVMPGGYGAAKNLSDLAIRGADCEVEPDLSKVLAAAVLERKPIVAICIAPAVLAAALRTMRSHAVTLTIGTDEETSQVLTSLGARHQRCTVSEIAVDSDHRVVSTPAYMLGEGPAAVGAGIRKAIDQLMVWIGS